MNWMKHLVTGRDNETHDLGRWSWLISILAVLGHSIWTAAHGIQVGLVDLATALTAVSTGHGIAIGVKKDTEPEKKEET